MSAIITAEGLWCHRMPHNDAQHSAFVGEASSLESAQECDVERDRLRQELLRRILENEKRRRTLMQPQGTKVIEFA